MSSSALDLLRIVGSLSRFIERGDRSLLYGPMSVVVVITGLRVVLRARPSLGFIRSCLARSRRFRCEHEEGDDDEYTLWRSALLHVSPVNVDVRDAWCFLCMIAVHHDFCNTFYSVAAADRRAYRFAMTTPYFVHHTRRRLCPSFV